MHYIKKKNNLFLARFPGISANWNENYKRCKFQAVANISGKFPKILIFPENLQSYCESWLRTRLLAIVAETDRETD